MFDYLNYAGTMSPFVGGHSYEITAVGPRLRMSAVRPSRESANRLMYAKQAALGLSIVSVEDDKHEKTYVCNDGTTFQINRV